VPSNECRSTGLYGAIKADSGLRSSATYTNRVPRRQNTIATKGAQQWRKTVPSVPDHLTFCCIRFGLDPNLRGYLTQNQNRQEIITRGCQSEATNVGLSQRVYIIGETCLNSFNRAHVGACQCERALTNVEPHFRIWIIPTRFDSPGVTIERACPIRSRNTARTPYSGRLEYATGPLIGWAPNGFIAIRV